MPRAGVHDQGHRTSMAWRWAEIYAESSALLPLGHALPARKGVVKHISGASERVEMAKFGSDRHPSELLQRGVIFTLSRCGIGHVVSMPHGIWPEADEYHLFPLIHGVQHGRPGLFL